MLATQIEEIIKIGRSQLEMPVNNLDGVEKTLSVLKGLYKLVVVTKGDLLDQERKLIRSGLESNFHHIEIVSEKTSNQYKKLLRHLDIAPEEFLMVGNSLKSDILPILELGCYGVHIPFHTTWEHERIDQIIEHEQFAEIENISQIMTLLKV